MKNAGIGFIILIITLLTFKFIMWNFWKVENAVKLTKGILNAPSAVNLTILKGNSILFQKSFAYNREGNYYIVNHFDITPHLSNDSAIFRLKLNNQKITSIVLYRFKTFHIVNIKDHYFVFPIGKSNIKIKSHSDIETFVEIRDSIPFIIHSLFKLAIYEEKEKRELVYTLLSNSQTELKYGTCRFFSELSIPFEKEKIYEIVFDYKVTGTAVPMVMLTTHPYSPDDLLVHRVLDTSVQSTYRKASIIFRSRSFCRSPVLYLLKRGQKRRDGIVCFKNISLYRYKEEYQWLGQLTGSGAACFDFINKIKKNFIEVSYINYESTNESERD
jgi:hypothetical protein